MKRIGVALACLVFAGTAGAAIVGVPATPAETVTTISQEPAYSPVVKVAAPVSIEGRRAPVPYVPQPKTPVELASLEPTVVMPEIRPAPAAQFNGTQNRDLARATVREVRNLSESQCGGRSMKSITVLGDGTVKVQC